MRRGILSDTSPLMHPQSDHHSKRTFLLSLQYYVFRILGPLLIILMTLIFGLTCIFRVGYSNIVSDKLFLVVIGCSVTILVGFLMFMVIFSLSLIIFGDIGHTEDSIKRFSYMLDKDYLDSLPVCSKCSLPKPERAHHCSVCGKCCLMMDHHCPAVGVCITIRNVQPFLVMLYWGQVACFTVAVILAINIIFHHSITSDVMLDSVTAAGGLIISGALGVLRNDVLGRLSINRTLVEQMFRIEKNYNMGVEENLRMIYGNGRLAQYWPRKSRMTGFEWQARINIVDELAKTE